MIEVLVTGLVIGLIVAWIRWWYGPKRLEPMIRSSKGDAPDNVIRKNVERPCTRCGQIIMVDAFTADPLCINCLDGKDA